MSYSFLPEAEAEYLEAVSFYEDRQQGLGGDLIADFEGVMKRVVERPTTWKIVHPSDIRRIGLKQFPYSVFYRVLPDHSPQVTAFAHHRRAPGYWRGRIKD